MLVQARALCNCQAVLRLVLAAGSNTGCLCAASLVGGEMLMRGHKQHDDQLQALLNDPAFTCAMLVSSAVDQVVCLGSAL